MLSRRILRGGLLVCLMLPAGLFAQTSPLIPDAPPGWIDGSKHPEQIPEYASYRLVLMHLNSLSPSRLQTRIAWIGLSAADSAVLKNELAVFASEYGQWQAHAGTHPTAQDDAAAKSLVLQVRTSLLNLLTPDGTAKLVHYVQGQRVHMHVSP